MRVSGLPLYSPRFGCLAHLDGEIVTSAVEIASAGVMRSSDAMSGKSPEESLPKVRRKLPVPMPKWAGQVSPCNDVSQSFGEADVKVMPQLLNLGTNFAEISSTLSKMKLPSME